MLKALLSPHGRRSRLTYWRAAALVPLLALLAMVVVTLALTIVRSPYLATNVIATWLHIVVVFATLLVALWAGFAIAIQRLHDRDRSGWWVMIALVPIVGTIWYLLWNGLRPGTPGSNRFGAPPVTRYSAAAAVFDDGPAPPTLGRTSRGTLVSTIIAWVVLVAMLAFILLFQAPERRAPRLEERPTAPIER